MSRKSKLTNLHTEPYDETINGKRYLIQPGETITLGRSEAVSVRGFYRKKITKLKLEHLPDDTVEIKGQEQKVVTKYVGLDGKAYDTKEELLKAMHK